MRTHDTGLTAVSISADRDFIRILSVILLRNAVRLLMPAVLVCALVTGASAQVDEFRFVWDEGNARMSAVSTPDGYQAAVNIYRDLFARGVRNGPLLFNYGTALLKAGRHAEAVEAFLSAERYSGSTHDITVNLVLAVNRGDPKGLTALPWYRPLLFWHYGLPCPVRTTIAALAFGLVWIALTLRVLKFTGLAGPLLIAALAVFVLFGSSAATSVHQEQVYRLKPVDLPAPAGTQPAAEPLQQGARP